VKLSLQRQMEPSHDGVAEGSERPPWLAVRLAMTMELSSVSGNTGRQAEDQL